MHSFFLRSLLIKSLVATLITAPVAFAQTNPDPTILTVSDNGSSRATGYTMSTKIIRKGNFTYIAYLGFGESIFVRTLNHTTGTWSTPYLIGTAVDNHGAPAMAMDSLGYLHIIYGPHQGVFKYRISTHPNDASTWNAETYFGSSATYGSVVIDANDIIHVVYRGGGTSNSQRNLMYQKKVIRSSGTAKPTNWSAPVTLVDGGNLTVSYDNSIALGADQSLNVGFHFYDGIAGGGRKIGFMKSLDAGRTWRKMSGEQYNLPVTYASTQTIFEDPNVGLRLSNVSMDSKGNAYLTMNRLKDIPRVTSLVKIDVTGHVQIIDLGSFIDPATYDYDGYSSMTVDSANRLWVAAPFVNKGDTWGGPSTSQLILRMSADVFDLSAIVRVGTLTPTLGSPGPYWLSVWERFAGHNDIGDQPRLLFTQGYGNTSSSVNTTIPTTVLLKSSW